MICFLCRTVPYPTIDQFMFFKNIKLVTLREKKMKGHLRSRKAIVSSTVTIHAATVSAACGGLHAQRRRRRRRQDTMLWPLRNALVFHLKGPDQNGEWRSSSTWLRLCEKQRIQKYEFETNLHLPSIEDCSLFHPIPIVISDQIGMPSRILLCSIILWCNLVSELLSIFCSCLILRWVWLLFLLNSSKNSAQQGSTG